MILVQPCVHDLYGVLSVAQPTHWAIHFASAQVLRGKLAELDAQIELLPVDSSGSRSVTDARLVRDLYLVGTGLAVQKVLGLHHLVLWLEQLSPANIGKADTTARLGAALTRLGYRVDLKTGVRYTRLCEIDTMRHLIEHPTPENIYATDPSAWEGVPLMWIASGRAASAFDVANPFLREVVTFARECEERRTGSRTLQVQRGMKVLNQARKPRFSR